jgi:hypothetical protein
LEFFEKRIRPVLVEHCYACHAVDAQRLRGGLQLDSREALLRGGDSGPVVVPGKPEASLLLEALRYETYQMPPDGKLSDQVIADFSQWISMGAPDPRLAKQRPRPPANHRPDAAEHWAFQPMTAPSPPEISAAGQAWSRNPIDPFIYEQLDRQAFSPAPAADKRTLIRRATFDLIGLPPTVEEVQGFLDDDSSDAFAKVVERLLASPHYGQRWGRHWLDLVRYADTNGADENHAMPQAWRYRDWVVRQWNRDLPLDEFIIQQLAGDLLPVPDDEFAAGELLTATGMLVIGPKMLAEQDKDKMMIDIVDEQIDTVGRTLFGLTLSCARCHDHKFDPITSRDYYALAGIFHSTQAMANRAFVSKWMERPLPSRAIDVQRASLQPRLTRVKAKLQRLKKLLDEAQKSEPAASSSKTHTAAQAPSDELSKLQQSVQKQEALLKQLEQDMPQHTQVMAVQDGPVQDLPIHLRGNHLTPSPQTVPRNMPQILTTIHPAPSLPAQQSGRKELAEWLVSPAHPLTARVMANRLWMWHFGQGLVRSPSNFGLQAEPPTHPALLDYLATELIRQGWSLKAMHRLIMLSATYQMSSQGVAADEERDPENRWWRRSQRRRLEAEALRDAILFAGGQLELRLGDIAADTESTRRALYLPVNRSALYEMFSIFDYVEPGNHIEQRSTTTVPQQALFSMNSSLVIEQAANIARELVPPRLDATLELEALIGSAFERLFARRPSFQEVRRAKAFWQQIDTHLTHLEDQRERQLQACAALCRTLLATNEFIYLD